MATRKVHRKQKSHSKTKHGKRKTRKQNKRRRRQRRRTHVLRGGAGQHFEGAKVWNPETGGNVYPLNQDVSPIPESERFGPIQITPSVYDGNRGQQDVVIKDLPAQAGGRRRRRRTNRKQKKGRKSRVGRKHKGTRRRRKRRTMRGGSGGSTVCPSCPNANNVGPASPNFSDFLPQAVKDVYRGTVDTIENTNNAFAGKAPINDDSNISNQPIAKGISNTPPNVNMPHNVGKIMKESQMSVGHV